ncbi:MAG: efflux RND transporter periplasmic adaptor subunit [Rhodocyclaceae bacterium]|nr:efflux RND transporter periplasmic adaptor subunit [Rhodocyclaceae bacterium]
MKITSLKSLFALLVIAVPLAVSSAVSAPPVAKPSLTVTVEKPRTADLPLRLNARGNLVAWQEAIIGTEVNGLRLLRVNVNVGDVVKRGQVLAEFSSEMITAELAQTQAQLTEAEAEAANAAANGDRARGLRASGAITAQLINQYLTAEQTAKARVEAYRAAERVQKLRLAQTRVLAPDSGVISARTATVGAVVPAGMELFRLIRQGRLEWRAELTAAEMARVKAGALTTVQTPAGNPVIGKVRVVAPTVDALTRTGLVFVDLPVHPGLKAGMFVSGEFDVGSATALLVSPQAVVVRDGFNYVFRLGTDNKVSQIKVTIGRRSEGKIEVVAGLGAEATIVVSGAGFLNDGDTVKVVSTPTAPATKPAL